MQSPTRILEEAKQQALEVRASLEASGWDHGPISVHDKMLAMGLPAPSIASLARIFRERGVARLEPKKRPRSSYRRFVYPAPNACWQLDATEYVLAKGRKCVIFQLVDDHSRVAVASLAAGGETSKAAIEVFRKGVASRGVPQRLLTDNGLALNPSRRGWRGALVGYANALGVETITSKPEKPTTQGKNERFHQTLFRWLDKQPMAATLTELQTQIDEFDQHYNHHRPHQGLPGRITPQTAWDATLVAQAPEPLPDPLPEPLPIPPAPRYARPSEMGEYHRKVQRAGTISLQRVNYQVGAANAGRSVHAIIAETTVTIIDDETGEVLLERPLPPAGTRYVGNDKFKPKLSPMS